MVKEYMIALGFAAALVLAGTGVGAQTISAPMVKPSATDEAFLDEAIEGDLGEINVGKLAREKGQSQTAKNFGQMLEHDHSQNLQKAEKIAQQMNLTPPSGPDAKQKKTYDQLSKLSGAQFDRQFAQAMVKDHKQVINKFKKKAKSNGPFANFAEQTVPTLEKHLQTAQSLVGKER